MGQTTVTMTIHGPEGPIEVEALADTAATFTKVPRSTAIRAGLVAQCEAPIELGDGRTISRSLAPAEVELDGVRRLVLVALSEEGETPLIGHTTLETLGFKVNPATHSLERTTAIEY